MASICPSVAHQVVLDLDRALPPGSVLEPPAFELLRRRADTGVVSHVWLVESYPGPFPFLADPDYPGWAGAA